MNNTQSTELIFELSKAGRRCHRVPACDVPAPELAKLIPSEHRADTPPPLATYANNDGWFDDASDGPVTATVTIRTPGGTREMPVDAAWVLCAPPDFAPRVRPIITLYDLLTDLAVRFLPLPANSLFAPASASSASCPRCTTKSSTLVALMANELASC